MGTHLNHRLINTPRRLSHKMLIRTAASIMEVMLTTVGEQTTTGDHLTREITAIAAALLNIEGIDEQWISNLAMFCTISYVYLSHQRLGTEEF